MHKDVTLQREESFEFGRTVGMFRPNFEKFQFYPKNLTRKLNKQQVAVDAVDSRLAILDARSLSLELREPLKDAKQQRLQCDRYTVP